MNVVTELLNTINSQVDYYTFDGYHAVVSMFSNTLTTLLVIYFAGLGWLVIRGLIPLTPMALAWHMAKAAFIVAFALHWDYFSFFAVNNFLHGPDQLMNMMSSAGGQADGSASAAVRLAQLWETGNNVFANVWRNSGPDFMLGTLMGMLGFAGITAVTAMALFYLIMSKIALSVLLIVAPVVMPMYLWKATRGICNSWVQLIVQWAITPLFLYAFLGLVLKPLQTQVTSMAQMTGGANTAGIATFVLFTVVICGIFKQAGALSRHLAAKIEIGEGGGFGESVPYMALKSLRHKEVL